MRQLAIPISFIRLRLARYLNIKELGQQAVGILVNCILALNFEPVGTSCFGHTSEADMMVEVGYYSNYSDYCPFQSIYMDYFDFGSDIRRY